MERIFYNIDSALRYNRSFSVEAFGNSRVSNFEIEPVLYFRYGNKQFVKDGIVMDAYIYEAFIIPVLINGDKFYVIYTQDFLTSESSNNQINVDVRGLTLKLKVNTSTENWWVSIHDEKSIKSYVRYIVSKEDWYPEFLNKEDAERFSKLGE
ncbi:MAG: hypothetical protein JHC31_05065 [Sulfurihydrogenibium sp.]|jgi:hypothetical protein|nr:hypothetical protein [Sulfurihydrogenibium sp.]